MDPDDYHLTEIREQIAQLGGSGRSSVAIGRTVDLELLLTDGFLLYATHLLQGHLDAATLHPNWRAERRERDLVALLSRTVEEGNPASSLAVLRPPQPEYRRLMEALDAYRELARQGGWPSLPEGPGLSPGDTSRRVPALRARLSTVPTVAGDDSMPNPAATSDSLRYGPDLAAAVRAFQRRHGLEPDAVVGPATREALNRSASDRVRQIEVNLERWRWLPEEPGRLSRPVPVHLLYWTTFVGDDSSVQFRPDVYDRDAPVAHAMRRPPPEPAPVGELLPGSERP